MNASATSVATPDPRRAWAAVLARDARQDTRFVYGVSSTKVFCKPSCPSRRPDRARVRFFSDAAAATAAGFRPCRRCQPERAIDPPAERLLRTRASLDARPDERVTLAQLGQAVGLSPAHLQRAFARMFGMSPRAYIERRRVERLKARLKQGDTVTAATYEAGYGSGSRVYERAHARLGMTPGAYRRGGRGMAIAFTIARTRLGLLLVGETTRGVCAVSFGSARRALISALGAEYPHAELAESGRRAGARVRAVIAAVERGVDSRRIPLDATGTAFEWKVWKALQAIPRGETRSYGAVATAVSAPNAARAVARACARNRLAVIVPCHRVIRRDGALGGYRWGIARKRKLIDSERGG